MIYMWNAWGKNSSVEMKSHIWKCELVNCKDLKVTYAFPPKSYKRDYCTYSDLIEKWVSLCLLSKTKTIF